MSEAFQTVLVKDDRLDCKDHVKYAVEKGGANVTFSPIPAIGNSSTSQTFNIIVPSEQTIIDRRVNWEAVINFQLQFTGLPNGSGAANTNTQQYDLVQYGLASALCSFPLHSCCTVVSSTINNNTISQNMDDVLQPMIRFLNRKHIHKYTGYTPIMPDNYLNYGDGINNINNALGAFNNAEKESDFQARGSFELLSINGTPGYVPGFNTIYSGGGGTYTLYVSVALTEPFMMSPFIFAHEKQNDQGFYGVQNLNFKLNLNPNARIWRQAPITNLYTAAPVAIPAPTVQIDGFPLSQLVFCYLTPHPEDLLPAKNCVGFLEMPRYITPGSVPLAPYTTVQVQTQTLQLNQVPDKLIVMVRRKNLTTAQPDSFIPIETVSINWNNASGLLATATQQDLWLMSVESGIQQSYLEWTGTAHNWIPTLNGGVLPVGGYPSGNVPLVGGILALDFAKHIQLTESYYSPGSLGTFQLQIRLGINNQDPANTVAAANWEIVVITLNSGVFVCERGTSSTYTGILTKQDVLDASSKPAYYKSDVARCVGAGLMDNLKTVVGHALHRHGGGESGGGMSGGGTSGGDHAEIGSGMSGGGPSGGRRHHHRMAGRLV